MPYCSNCTCPACEAIRNCKHEDLRCSSPSGDIRDDEAQAWCRTCYKQVSMAAFLAQREQTDASQ